MGGQEKILPVGVERLSPTIRYSRSLDGGSLERSQRHQEGQQTERAADVVQATPPHEKFPCRRGLGPERWRKKCVVHRSDRDERKAHNAKEEQGHDQPGRPAARQPGNERTATSDDSQRRLNAAGPREPGTKLREGDGRTGLQPRPVLNERDIACRPREKTSTQRRKEGERLNLRGARPIRRLGKRGQVPFSPLQDTVMMREWTKGSEATLSGANVATTTLSLKFPSTARHAE